DAVRRRRRHAEAIERGLPSAREPVGELPEELVEGLRRVISAAGGRKHWHGSHEPCPVCGGTPLPFQLKSMTRRGVHDPATCLMCGGRPKETRPVHPRQRPVVRKPIRNVPSYEQVYGE